jgi:hypothetical protein
VVGLERRVQKLEALLSDGSGLRPDSPEWLDYWARKASRILTGEEPGQPGCIPLEVWDVVGNPDRGERDEQDVGSGAHDLAQMAPVGTPGPGNRYR